MSKIWFLVFPFILIILIGIGIFLAKFSTQPSQTDITKSDINLPPKQKPLEKFTFDNLARRDYLGSEIILEREIEVYEKQPEEFKTYLFSYLSDGKKITGQVNIPMTPKSNKMPVVILIRGYVDQTIYETGIGTKKAAEAFAKMGYLTLAPDFLGYGDSDKPEDDVWWERLNNPVQVLNLLASLKKFGQADPDKVAIWAHSNGGQIALSVLEISQKPIPTTLWAPVSKPFPYSILYYTDEFDDQGKALRKELAHFESDYDVSLFSITKYFDRIKAPIAVRQGTSDEAVPLAWSEALVKNLKDLDIDVEYNVYPAADHNMLGAWDKAIERDLQFFKKNLNIEISDDKL